MAELELARLHEDGEHLVLRDPDGAETLLAITEALRAAVRRDRPRVEELQARATTTLRPRELQSRLRAGATAEELAEESGLPVDHVQRYEWPVVAERSHVISQVRAHRRGGDGDVAPLGEVAGTRLAARGVTAGQAQWSARRDGTAPWVVEVRFHAGDRDRSARWTYDPKARVVTALDDEARWLGQPDDPVSPEMLGVPSVIGRRASVDADREHDDATTLLLDDLAGRRGQRPTTRRREPAAGPGRPQPDPVPVGRVSVPGLDTPDRQNPAGAADDVGGASVVDLGSRRAGVRTTAEERTSREPASSTPEPAGASTAAAGEAPAETAGNGAAAREPSEDAAPVAAPAAGRPAGRTAAARRPARKGRPQVPSWDEIVFGGRPTT
ncbi:DUF3071 domain-containing protein [Isoptericola sp. NEAU-Y5]|uniref:DUF3071 domain-containing protein n=1 Tax=Isoptericola luteus TaxID=2879484 RepID=A0ABS7ZFV7_9MICO|nr:septation protein SepH [Isoptericola sp. NEAU-Y5]MCA5893909.1 DUF3071 domain-containing protein [Isoptericola sp. NEAU-Y5]